MRMSRPGFSSRRLLRLETLESRRLLSVFSADESAGPAHGGEDPISVPEPAPLQGPTFTDIEAGLPGVVAGSVAWGDYDNDGDLDILLTGYAGSTGYGGSGCVSRVYRNNNGTFTNIDAGLQGVFNSSVAWGDYDTDGDLDILLAGRDGSALVSRVYRNDNGTFTDIDAGLPGVEEASVAWGDYDNDGDLDILLTGYDADYNPTSGVYRNDAGTFTDIEADLPSVTHSSVAWGDYDNDGDLDILLTGHDGSALVSRVYRNDNGTFTDIEAGLPGVTDGSVAWGDYDNDGDLDILLAGFDYSPIGASRVYRNDGGTFIDIEAGLPDVEAVSVAWGDYDNDGDLDILLAGCGVTRLSRVYRNDGGTFNEAPGAPTDLAAAIGSTSVTLSWTAPADHPPTPGGTATPSDGLSYNLRVGTAPGAGDVVGPMSFAGTTAPPDGLRKVSQRGPIQGTSWTLADLTAGRTYYWSVQAIDTALAGGPFATEGSFAVPPFADIEAGLPGVGYSSVAWGDYDDDGDLDILLTGINPSGDRISRVYRNDGGTFNDIAAGLPGVGVGSVAWGDYDNDGDLDILLTGFLAPLSTVSRVYRNDGGTFTDIGAGLPHVGDGSVAWGDYDNDGDLDILLTGYDADYNPISRVYRNDGGTFTDIGAGLPGVGEASVAWGDYDNDGDLDILLTGEVFGATRIARVYRNDGGTFTDIAAGLPGVANGSAAWGDYDNDGDLDILLNGDPFSGDSISRVYRNDGGTFTDIQAGLLGVAGSVAWGDYDNDGDLDILLTGEAAGGNRISRVYRNDDGTFTDIAAGLPGVVAGSVAWGDYDNDGDLDILLTGFNDAGGRICRVYRNDGGTFNEAPGSPTDLAAAIDSTSVTLSWTAPADHPTTPGGTATPSDGLSYNLRVGTAPGAGDVVGPMSFGGTTAPPDGQRKVPQRGPIQGTSWTLADLTAGRTYYWSVQAIDTALAGGHFATEGSFAIPPDSLGALDFLELDLGSVSAGTSWYSLEAVHDALLTVEAAAGTVDLTLYDESFHVLQSAPQRVESTATAGATYYFSIDSGVAQEVSLRLANLVHVGGEGYEITVHGTQGDDAFRFDADKPSGVVGSFLREVTINAVVYRFWFPVVAGLPAFSVEFAGSAGCNTAVLRGAGGDDSAEFRPGQATLSGTDFTAAVTEVEVVTAVGTSEDVAVLYGSDQGGDLFSARPGSASLGGTGFCNRAIGFGQIEAVATPGGALVDTAKFYDSDGIDLFEATPEYARITYDDGSTARATGFGYVVGKATAGGNDLAQLHDSPDGKDYFTARLGHSRLCGADFFIVAVDFDRVRATATSARIDQAALYDSDGDDRLEAAPGHARLLFDGREDTFVEAVDFPIVWSVAKGGGHDRAELYDSDTSRDVFVGRPKSSALHGPGFYIAAVGFEEVEAIAAPGQPFVDTAKLYDSAGIGLFEATPDYARMTYQNGSTARATGFGYVVGRGTSGGSDLAQLYGSPGGKDSFTGRPGYSKLTGTDFFIVAAEFARVQAIATSAQFDRATLYDSDGDDRLEAAPGYARLRFDGSADTFVEAVNFPIVRTLASEGGHDRAELYDSGTSLDTFVGRPDSSTFYGPGFYNTAVRFAEVLAHASPDDGFDDRAKLYDSDGDDTFWAGPSSPEGNRLAGTTLAGHGFSYTVDGFYHVIGHSHGGGDDEAHLYGADGSQDFLRAFFASDYREMFDSATYKTTAKGFEKTMAYGVRSDADRAIFHDSALDEYLEADATKDPARAILSNSDRMLEVSGFAHVKPYRSEGNDTKHVVEPLDFVLRTVGDWRDI